MKVQIKTTAYMDWSQIAIIPKPVVKLKSPELEQLKIGSWGRLRWFRYDNFVIGIEWLAFGVGAIIKF